MWVFAASAVVWAIVGSFGTAFIHERTGRDVQMGGIIGLAVGAIGQLPLLVFLWIWLYYISPYRPVGRMYGTRRRNWYRWWE